MQAMVATRVPCSGVGCSNGPSAVQDGRHYRGSTNPQSDCTDKPAPVAEESQYPYDCDEAAEQRPGYYGNKRLLSEVKQINKAADHAEEKENRQQE